MAKPGLAIVGCGRIGARHAEVCREYFDLLAVCDTDFPKAQQIAALYGAKAYGSIEDLLHSQQGIELIAICTPNYLHASHSIAALREGINVLCEKPMAITVAEAKAMLAADTQSQAKLFVVKQNRLNPPVEAVRRLLNEGGLGRILSFQVNCFWNRSEAYYLSDWKGKKEKDGGALYTQFSHFIDLLYWFLGDVDSIQSITGNAYHPQINIDDHGVAIIKMRSGAIGTLNYSNNAFAKNMEGSITLIGEKGTVKIGGEYLNELEYQQIDNFQINNLPKGQPANNYGHYSGSMSNHGKVYELIARYLSTGEGQLPDGHDGLKTVEIIERIYKTG